MAKQTFTSGATLLASEMNALQTNDFNLTVSTKTAAYTFVVGDRGTRVVLNDTTARTFTINNSIFDAGDTINVHNINTGLLTIAAGAGVTLNGASTLTVAQYQSGIIYFTSASSAIFFPSDRGLQTARIAATRDMTAASGSVAYTGAGFTPTAAFAFGAIQFGIESHSFADSSRNAGAIYSPGNAAQNYNATSFIVAEPSGGASQVATISSYDSDGITLSWTKSGAPTGTFHFYMLLMR